jgi:hypothetical protein
MSAKTYKKIFNKKFDLFVDLLSNSWNKIINLFNNLKISIVLEVIGWLVLLSVSIYIGIQASVTQQVVSDQFISTYIFSDALKGVPMVSTDHTNIIKIIPLWIQGNFGYSLASYVGLNIAFILGSISLWVYLIGRIFGSKVRTIALFTFSAVLFASTSFAINITMTTLRHIEYPLGLLFVLLLAGLLLNKPKRFLARGVLIASLLAILILNDKYFLYTLVPAVIIGVIFFSLNQIKKRYAVFTIVVVLIGASIGLLLPSLLNHTGLISILPGYVRINSVVDFDALFNSVLLTIKQTLNLFGGLIFGQQAKVRNATIFLLLFIPIISAIAIRKMSKVYTFAKTPIAYFIHITLTAWILMAYAVYILSGSTTEGNDRYLTLIVFIGITYFSWFVWRLSNSKNNRTWLVFAVCLVMLISIPLSYPRVHSAYRDAKIFSSSQAQAAKETATILESNNIKLLAAPFGYYSLKFFAPTNNNLTIVGVDHCNLPNVWSNNGDWIYNNKYTRSAYIFEEKQYAPTQENFCSEADLIQLFGQPDSILRTPSMYAAGKQTKIYVYNYDIRSHFDTSGITPKR